MNKHKKALGVAALVALAAILLFVFWPTSKAVDGDFKSNCWAHMDKNGSRHCAAATAPRFGYSH